MSPGSNSGALNYDQTCTLDGKPSVALAVYQLPGTNAIDTADRVKAKMKELRGPALAHGIDYAIVYDTTPFIRESIDEVFNTLRDAVILVAIVMLVFLQSWRAAIIPLAAVPVAIIGTFAAMSALNYSVNNLTLFGLVLAVGIVVDDAIVVVEAVQHYIEEGFPPKEATGKAMDAVAGPVVAVGLVLTAVFVPCVFISGIVGQFYRQFAVTIAVSTLISAFNSLTLSPALCALLLKPHREGEASEPLPRIVFPLIGAGLAYWLLVPYLRTIPFFAALPGWTLPVLVTFAAMLVGWFSRIVLNRTLGYLFRGFNIGFRRLHLGLSRRRRRCFANHAGGAADLRRLPVSDVLRDHDHAERVHSAAGQGLSDGECGAAGRGIARSHRRPDEAARIGRPQDAGGQAHGHRVRAIEAPGRERPELRHALCDARCFPEPARSPNWERTPSRRNCRPISRPRCPEARDHGAGRTASGWVGECRRVQDDYRRSERHRSKSARSRRPRTGGTPPPTDPELRDVFTGFRADTPWLQLNIDRDAAQTMGVSVARDHQCPTSVFRFTIYQRFQSFRANLASERAGRRAIPQADLGPEASPREERPHRPG